MGLFPPAMSSSPEPYVRMGSKALLHLQTWYVHPHADSPLD